MINYKYRVHDVRIGRFLSIDPLTKDYPMYSPYHFSSNQPIHAEELEGLESRYDLNSGDPNFYRFEKKEQEHLRKVHGRIGAIALGMMATPLLKPIIASEVALLSGTSWAPIMSNTIGAVGGVGLGTRLTGSLTDAGGQVLGNMIGSEHFNVSESLSKINLTSVTLSFLNPSSRVSNLMFNGWLANSLQSNYEGRVTYGSFNQILTGTLFEAGVGWYTGKVGDGALQANGLLREKQMDALWNKTFQDFNSPEMSKLLYESPSDFHKAYESSMSINLKLDMTVGLKNASEKYSLSLGGQAAKNAAFNEVNKQSE